MTESYELSSLVQEMRQLAAETKALREKLAEQDKLVAALSNHIQAAEQSNQPASTSLARVTSSPTSRRKMLKAGILAAGIAVTTAGPLAAMAADKSPATPVPPLPAGTGTAGSKKNISPTADGSYIQVATASTPTTANSKPTRIVDPSNIELSPILFQIDNYSSSLQSLPSNTRIAIAGTVSGVDTTNNTRIGIYGSVDSGYGVYGKGTNGVYGIGTNGVYGIGTNGVYGATGVADGNAVYAYASGLNAWGVAAYSESSYGGVFSGGGANIRLDASGNSPLLRTDYHYPGEIIVDSDGTAWICVAVGAPGTWRQIASTNTAGSFHILTTPVRVLDTRSNGNIATVTASSYGGIPAGTFGDTEARTYDLSGASSPVPAGATAFAAIVTAININMTSTQSGYFQTWTGALSPVPAGSIVTYNVAGKANSGSFISALTSTRRFNLYTLYGADIIIDITGYYL